VETPTHFFWNSPLAVRFGVTPNLYAFDEIPSFRKARSAANLARKILRLDIIPFGHDHAHVSVEFERTTEAPVMK